jgi:hypothetical protein
VQGRGVREGLYRRKIKNFSYHNSFNNINMISKQNITSPDVYNAILNNPTGNLFEECLRLCT